MALIIVVVVLALTAQLQVWSSPAAYDVGGRLLNAAVALLYTLPLLVARRWPLTVLVVVLGAVALDYGLDGHGGQQWFAILIAVFSLGSYATSMASAIGMVLVGAATLAVDIPRLQQGDPVDEVLPGWFVLAGAWGLGAWLQRRRVALADLTQEAEALAREVGREVSTGGH